MFGHQGERPASSKANLEREGSAKTMFGSSRRLVHQIQSKRTEMRERVAIAKWPDSPTREAPGAPHLSLPLAYQATMHLRCDLESMNDVHYAGKSPLLVGILLYSLHLLRHNRTLSNMAPNVGLGTQGPIERGWSLWLTSVIAVVVAGFFVGARLAQRLLKRSGFGVDDYMIMAALLASILLTVTECQGQYISVTLKAMANFAQLWYMAMEDLGRRCLLRLALLPVNGFTEQTVSTCVKNNHGAY